MKLSLTIFLLLFYTNIQAQETQFEIKKGGYFTAETGGYGALPMMTLGYEYIKPLNENMFLSTRTGVNGFVYLFSVGIGVPHGVSINFGKKHVYFETGLNGWYGFTDNGEMNGDGFSYVIGMNLGLNVALGAKYPKVMYRIYANPWYNPTSNNGLIRQTFIWAGIGLSVRLHD